MSADLALRYAIDAAPAAPDLRTVHHRALRGLELAMAALDVPDLIVARVDGEITLPALQRAALRLQSRHAALSAQIERPAGARAWLRPAGGAAALPVVEIRAACDSPGGWQALVQHEAAHRFADSPEPFRVLWIGSDEGGGHLLLNARHALVDGISLMRLLHELLGLLADPDLDADADGETAGRPQPTAHAVPPQRAALDHVPLGASGRMAAWLARRMVIRWQRHAADQVLFKVDGALERSGRVGTRCHFAVGEAGAVARLRRVCGQQRATVGGAYAAALQFAALRELQDAGAPLPTRLGRVALPIATEFNLRPLSAPPGLAADAVGLYSGGAEIGVRVSRSIDFWGLARRLSASTRQALKRRAPLLLHQVLDGVTDLQAELRRHGIDYRDSGGAASALNVSNVGRWPYSSRFGRLTIEEVYGLSGCLAGGPMHMFWLRSIDDRFCYNATSLCPAVAPASAERLFARTVELMERCSDADGAAPTLAAYLAAPQR